MKLPVKDFEYINWEKPERSQTMGYYCLINDSVRYEMSSQFYDAYYWHIPYIKSYINRNYAYRKELVPCFVKTIRKILQYWNQVTFHIH